MAVSRRDDKEEPVLTTRIDGEEVRLLVHIEPVEDAAPTTDDPPARPE